MAIPILAIMEGVKFAHGNWSSHIQSIRSFQELYGTMNLGIFVNLNADSHKGRDTLMEQVNIALKAHIFLTPATFIYNLYGGEIASTKWLAAYFTQFKSWRTFLNYRRERKGIWDWITVVPEFISMLTQLYLRYTTFSSTIDIMTHPWLFSTAIRCEQEAQRKIYGGDSLKTAKHLLQKIQQEQEDAEPTIIRHALIHLFHPVIDIEWVVIKATIAQLYVLERIAQNRPEGLTAYHKPAPYVLGQRFKFYENEQEQWWSELENEGMVEITPEQDIVSASLASDAEIEEMKELYGEENVKVYQLGTHGIMSPKIAGLVRLPPSIESINCVPFTTTNCTLCGECNNLIDGDPINTYYGCCSPEYLKQWFGVNLYGHLNDIHTNYRIKLRLAVCNPWGCNMLYELYPLYFYYKNQEGDWIHVSGWDWTQHRGPKWWSSDVITVPSQDIKIALTILESGITAVELKILEVIVEKA